MALGRLGLRNAGPGQAEALRGSCEGPGAERSGFGRQ